MIRRFCSLFLFLALLVVSGCKTAKDTTTERFDTVYVSRYMHDTLYISKVDSIYEHDSIYIKDKGDTVFYGKWHTKYVTNTDTVVKYIDRTDTIYISKNSAVEVTKTKKDVLSVVIAGVVVVLVLMVILKLTKK